MAWEKLGTTSVSSTLANNSWKELGRTTLGSAGDTIDVSSFAAKDNIMILGHYIPSGDIAVRQQFNSDTGSNYATRYSENGGADSTGTSLDKLHLLDTSSNNNDNFIVQEFINISIVTGKRVA